MLWNERLTNAIFIVFGVILALGVGVFRNITGGTFEVRWPEVMLLVLPVVLWSLASGQFETFRLSSTGLQIKTAIQKAAAKKVNINDKALHFVLPSASKKESRFDLAAIQRKRPESLHLQIRVDDYYREQVLSEYIYELSNTTGFKYFLFFDKGSSKPFLGGITGPEFCRSLNSHSGDLNGPNQDEEKQGKLTMATLTNILNSKEGFDFDLVRGLPGFIGLGPALRKSDDKRTALTKMDELGTTWLPVVDRNKLIGVAERPDLVAGLLLDVVRGLEGRSSS